MNGLRLAVDVGSTNTDAVVVAADHRVVASHKTPTTPDPQDGIRVGIGAVLSGVDATLITQAMLSTTESTNALVEGRGLARVGVLRLGAPATLSVPPLYAWAPHVVKAISGTAAVLAGGFQMDGSPIAPLDHEGVLRFAAACTGSVDAITVCGVFSPDFPDQEEEVAEILRVELGPSVPVTSSHQLGQLGLLERENASIANAALAPVLTILVSGFVAALHDAGVEAQVYVTQNDGTVIAADEAVRLPVLTIGSGAINSVHGAVRLTGLEDALVIDIGGASSNAGILTGGLPRDSGYGAEIAGVPTRLRMPDLVTAQFGGGSVVDDQGHVQLGGDGVRLARRRAVTLTDVAVASGRMHSPSGTRGPRLATSLVGEALASIDRELIRLCERTASSRASMSLVALGGAARFVPVDLPGVSEVIRPEHHAVASAIGAATAEASGGIDRIYHYDDVGRDAALHDARALAVDAAIRAGASADAVRIVAVTEAPVHYADGTNYRVRVKAIGPLQEVDHTSDER